MFDDAFALTKIDIRQSEEEERFITLGAIGSGSIVFVVHNSYAREDHAEVIRIISARPATSREKASYEEAHKRTKSRNREGRGKDR